MSTTTPQTRPPNAPRKSSRKLPQEPSPDHGVPLIFQRDICFGCGPANSSGLQLNFAVAQDGNSCICEFSLADRFVGPPGHAHGGIIATILDEAMSKANRLKTRKLNGKVALTRHIRVEYLRPVPLGQQLVVQGRVSRMSGRALYTSAELCNAKGLLLARGRGKFLAVDAEKMFARELENERSAAT